MIKFLDMKNGLSFLFTIDKNLFEEKLDTNGTQK